jgi:hypothetical protein
MPLAKSPHQALLAAVLLLPAASTVAEPGEEPVFHALEQSAARTEGLAAIEHLPPPVLTGLSATVDADGRVVYQCRVGDNPAYRAYRDRVDAAIRELERQR